MKRPKIDTSGTDAANRAIAEAQAVANNLSKNFQADLANENLTTVTAGGGAASVDTSDEAVRKRRSATGLSSQLGLDV